jgi:hypothetical protein
MSSYAVTFNNKSANFGVVCLYQADANANMPGMPLAWMCQPSAPDTYTTFQWTIDYAFIWDRIGTLVPGMIVKPSQMAPADPNAMNQITFTRASPGMFEFTNPTQRQPLGSLIIQQDGTIPLNQLAVGISMSGSGTFAVQAQPNTTAVFTPRPSYWITFGQYTAGQVLDPGRIPNSAEIIFPPDVFTMTAALNADNSWTISS